MLMIPARLALCVLASLLFLTPPLQAAESEDLLWPRIAAGMRIVDGEAPETVTWARHYAKRPQQFAQMLSRSEPFLWYIVEAVELRDMPLELALLPAVESGFDPQAHSRSKARGLWQFIPATARGFGLRENATYDARRDAVASTRAALDYLQQLNRRFDSWLLALAAYNVGGAHLARAMREQEQDNFWLLDLPAETREHVPRLLGIALLIQQPARFGVELPPIPNRPSAEMIYLDRPRDLKRATEHADVPIETLEHYNPGLKSLSNSGDKRVVLLPPQDADRLRDQLARREYRPSQPKQIEHVIAPGDSLWQIARHYKVSVAQLREWNRLSERQTLRPGRTLLVRLSS